MAAFLLPIILHMQKWKWKNQVFLEAFLYIWKGKDW